jgi:hypothetical protein
LFKFTFAFEQLRKTLKKSPKSWKLFGPTGREGSVQAKSICVCDATEVELINSSGGGALAGASEGIPADCPVPSK